jgi:hypothetical protein
MSKPLSREFLLERGKCCKNSCKNCPWGFGKRLIDRITNLQLEQNLLMSKVDDLINKTKNMNKKKYNYSSYCLGSSISINNKKLNHLDSSQDNSLLLQETEKLFNKLLLKHGSFELYKTLLQAYGEYESTEVCEQCGNYDEIINLEI